MDVIVKSSEHSAARTDFSGLAAIVAGATSGILGLTRTVALETAEHGVTVNAMRPGYGLAPLVRKKVPETADARGIRNEAVVRDVLLHAQPTRRFVTTEEIALAASLCTAAAASIIETALPADGGWTVQ